MIVRINKSCNDPKHFGGLPGDECGCKDMTKLTKLVDMNKIVEIEVDELVASEIKQLKAKVNRLQNKINELKNDEQRARSLIQRFSKENRGKIQGKTYDLVEALNDMDWIEIDGYLE